MADTIKATPVQNERLLRLSQLLRKGKEFGNKVQVPVFGGLGDMFVGDSPDEVENWAYGNNPVTIPEMSNVPQIRQQRKQGIADALGMIPFMGVSGGADQAIIKAIPVRDRDVLGDLVGELYDHTRKTGTPRQRHGSRQIINAVDDPGRLIASFDPTNNRVRGAASYIVDDDKLYLQNIGSTVPGSGTEMMDYIERLAGRLRRPVTLHSDPSAIGFYEKRGYSRTGNYSDPDHVKYLDDDYEFVQSRIYKRFSF